MNRMSFLCILLCLLINTIIKYTRGYDNIALMKQTWQYSTFGNHTSDKAVDGLKTNLSASGEQCSISNNRATRAEWWVNLENIFSIRFVVLYYRTENIVWDSRNQYPSRFLGFSLYISDTTKRNEGHLCFHDTNYTVNTIPPVVNISCPAHGQYVIYYNERLEGGTYPTDYSEYAFNELCEVEVYGCPLPGYYGKSCDEPCPSNCRYCHIETGICKSCKPGFQGHQCEHPCGARNYGEFCSKHCGNCTYGERCHPVTGICTNGCDVGVYGSKCKIPCPVGYYGKNCSQVCGHCDICDRFTGQCTTQCYAGWKGFNCNQECDGFTYGLECKETCGKCINLKQCHRVSGRCLEGCAPGSAGSLCKTECPPGSYGMNCKNTCSVNCIISGRCSSSTGHCENGCKAGWKGVLCDQECDNGHYGKDCEEKCNTCRNETQCNHINGSCLDGCKPGYKGDNCEKVLSDSDYKSSFYGILAAFCLCAVVNIILGTVLTLYCKKTRKAQIDKTCEEIDNPTVSKANDVLVYENTREGINNQYEDLGERSQPSNYENL